MMVFSCVLALGGWMKKLLSWKRYARPNTVGKYLTFTLKKWKSHCLQLSSIKYPVSTPWKEVKEEKKVEGKQS
jgi:hypothetical protein